MLESENSSLVERVTDLEQKVLSQQDEIVCMRSTLADVLRRLNLLDGNSERSANSLSKSTLGTNGRNILSTPTKNGTGIGSFNRMSSPSPTPSSMSSSTPDWKLKKPLSRGSTPVSSSEMYSMRKTSSATTTLNQR